MPLAIGMCHQPLGFALFEDSKEGLKVIGWFGHETTPSQHLDFLHVLRGLHIEYNLHLVWVCISAPATNHETQEFSRLNPKETFRVELHVLLAKDLESLVQISGMHVVLYALNNHVIRYTSILSQWGALRLCSLVCSLAFDRLPQHFSVQRA